MALRVFSKEHPPVECPLNQIALAQCRSRIVMRGRAATSLMMQCGMGAMVTPSMGMGAMAMPSMGMGAMATPSMGMGGMVPLSAVQGLPMHACFTCNQRGDDRFLRMDAAMTHLCGDDRFMRTDPCIYPYRSHKAKTKL